MQNKYLILFLFPFFTLLTPSNIFSQKANCGTVEPANFKSVKSQYPERFQQYVNDIESGALRTSGANCLSYAPMKIHIVRRSDGTGGLTLAELTETMDTLNDRYETMGITFYQCGAINYIDDNLYYDLHTGNAGSMTGANNVANTINTYFVNSVGNGTSNYCGYASYPGGADVIVMDNSCALNTSTMPHEMGHFFGLPHTHSGGDELVDGSNCGFEGDDFCDTPADPSLSGNVNSSCGYTGTGTDANGDPYLPDTRNIMSYSRKTCRDYFSVEQMATIVMNFWEVRDYWVCPDFDVNFTADVNYTCTNSLTVNFSENTIGATSYEWDFDNDGTIDATTPDPSHTYSAAGNYDVRLSISDGTNTIQHIEPKFIKLGSQPIPFTSEMDNFTVSYDAAGFGEGWTVSPANTDNSYRWNTRRGETLTSMTGPAEDQNLGSQLGVYLYTESTNGTTGSVAELISPCIDIPAGTSDPTVSFWYHMYGSSMGTLHVDLHDGTSWINDITTSISGQQQSAMTDAWLEKTFSVSAYVGQTIQLRFRGVRGTSFRSDMAIDNVQLFEVLPLPVELTFFEGRANDKGEHILSWQTASEENSAYFQLEHSTDGVEFKPLEKIPSAGNSSVFKNYQQTHHYPSAPDNYYRLKMVDQDESFTYSSIVYLPFTKTELEISIFPNPGNGQFQFHRSSPDQSMQLNVFNAVGQLVKTIEWNEGDYFYTLNLNALPDGIYSVQILQRDELIGLERIIKMN